MKPKTGLGRSNGAGSGTNKQKQEQEQQWPESLRRFVERCLAEVEEKDMEEMQKQLKEAITTAFSQNLTWTVDWDQKSLPILELRKSQKRKLEQKFSAQTLNENDNRKQKRQKRFEAQLSSSTPPPSTATTMEAPSTEPIVGRCTKLEKQYFRLTSEPDPETVRPLHILEQTLELLKRKWKEEETNYAYICDQFKSMRQDLTVQHIQNEFTVKVYEIHARIALEKGDLGEYNQCQSQLKQLYAQEIDGQHKEFLAYRILYLVHTQNRTEISHLLETMNEESRQSPAVRHALRVNEAMACGDYHRLFRLYANAPNMGGYVMDCFITRERLYALSAICRAYRPAISLDFVSKELGFQETDDCIEFLNDFGVQPAHGSGDSESLKLQTKESFPKLETARQNAFKKVDIKGQI